MDERSFQEMRKGLEIQFKYILYRRPGFKFFHSIGNWNFFQRFKSDDGKIDFGVLHVYWDKDAENMIDYVDKDGNVRPHSKQGDWRHRWLNHEDGYPVVAPFGNCPISEEGWKKIYQIHADKLKESLEKSATAIVKERLENLETEPKSMKDFIEDEIEDEEENHTKREKKILLN